jgi:pimeloyl-ACP methyl ester carboxylesterase
MEKMTQTKGGRTLSYADFGDPDGFPVLIQHGLIASIKDEHLFQRLADLGLRLISAARPGYGESAPYEMENIAEWGTIVSVIVNELALTRFDILGISSGAPYSYAIGYWYPERVRNIFILSGTPALFDARVLSHWPYPITPHASINEMQKLAQELFFSNVSAQDLAKNDIQDSMRYDCFGIAQDLKLRCIDWGFQLPAVKPRIFMRHSRSDQAVPLVTAELTARSLPNCQLEIREEDVHFSQEVLDDFIATTMAGFYTGVR